MSKETRKTLNSAIEAHLADEEDGAILRGFVLSVVGQTIDDAMLDPDEGSSIRGFWLVAPGQITPTSIGLALQLLDFTRANPHEAD